MQIVNLPTRSECHKIFAAEEKCEREKVAIGILVCSTILLLYNLTVRLLPKIHIVAVQFGSCKCAEGRLNMRIYEIFVNSFFSTC